MTYLLVGGLLGAGLFCLLVLVVVVSDVWASQVLDALDRGDEDVTV